MRPRAVGLTGYPCVSVEEEKKNTTTLVSKSKVMEKEAKQSDKESQPTESILFGSRTSKHSRPSSSSEGRRPEETRHGEASGMGPMCKNESGGDYCRSLGAVR